MRQHGRPEAGGADAATSVRLGELALEAGLPEGVLNVVPGRGRPGSGLVEHPDVAKIGFTGSTEVDATPRAAPPGRSSCVTLELGGKSANIVFADADLDAAAAAPYAVFGNAGQDCCARSDPRRALGLRPLPRELADATRGVRVGDPEDPATEMGPLVSAGHRDKVASFVDGNVTARGEIPDGPGFWFPCTVVEASNWTRSREEIFRPVAVVLAVRGRGEGIRIANDTPYGLSGSIWTENGALRSAAWGVEERRARST